MAVPVNKPQDIVYGLTDRPPIIKVLLLAFQQVLMVSLYLVLISFLAHKAGLSAAGSQNLVSLTLIAMGVAALLQVLWKGPVGSGFMISTCVAPTYLMPSLAALRASGLGLMAGMMIFSGIFEVIFAYVSQYLRFLFPRVVTGSIFCFLALTIAILSLGKIFHPGVVLHSQAFALPFFMYLFTLLLVIVLNIWASGFLRLLCVMLGVIVGAVVAYFFHLFLPASLSSLHQAAFFALPALPAFDFSFSAALMPVFIIASLAAGLRTMGVITTAQQINDAAWRRPDQQSISRGVIADGLSVIFSGLVGTMGVGVSPSGVGISKATGATSRVISFFVAGFCVLFAFIPKISALILAIPFSVVSAGLTFVSCLMFVGGLKIVTSEELTPRKTLTFTLSLFIALTPKLFPGFFAQMPLAVQSVTGSVMVFGSLSAIVLNLFFRIGVKQKATIQFLRSLGVDSYPQLEAQLSTWGIDTAISDVVIHSVKHLIKSILADQHNQGGVRLQLAFDEISLSVTLQYYGDLPHIEKQKAITEADLVEDSVFLSGLSSLYVDICPDKILLASKNKEAKITMVFFL